VSASSSRRRSSYPWRGTVQHRGAADLSRSLAQGAQARADCLARDAEHRRHLHGGVAAAVVEVPDLALLLGEPVAVTIPLVTAAASARDHARVL
jgi:hypothetical protein